MKVFHGFIDEIPGIDRMVTLYMAPFEGRPETKENFKA